MTAGTGREVRAGGAGAADVFAGPGEMPALCRAHDWAATPLGPPEGWAPALHAAVRLVLASPSGMSLWCGADYTLLYNDAYRRVLGAKHPGALGRSGAAVWAEIWPDIAPLFDQVRAGGPAVSAENVPFVVQRRDGGGFEEGWFDYALSAVRDEQGAVVAVLSVASDTTPRVRAERALAAGQARVARMLEAAPTVMAVYAGPEQVVAYVNPTWERVVGKPEALGRPFREVFPEMADTGLFERLTHVYETGEAWSVSEMRLPIRRRPDGPVEESYWDFLLQPQSGATGDGPSGKGADILVHAVEVTAQVRARREVERLLAESERAAAALVGSEAQYRALFASMDEGFLLAEVLFDDAGEAVDLLYLEANPAATRMTRVDYTGHRLRELDPGYEPYWLDTWARVARTGVGERHLRHAAPLDMWFDFYVFPVGDPGGRRVAVLFQDVTTRKRQEAHAAFLASMQDELSHLGSADEILQAVGARLGAYLNLATCSFIDVDESAAEQLTVSHTWSAAGVPSLLGRFRIEDYLQPEFARACRAGETVVVRDVHADPRTDGASYARFDIGAFVVVPFHRDGAWKFHLGVSVAAPRDWRDDEVALIEDVLGGTFPRLERARAEAALRANEARLRLALDVAELGTWTWELATGAGSLDARGAEIVGLPPGELPDVASAQFASIHPDDVARTQDAAAAGIASGEPFDLEYRVVLASGQVRHVASRARALADSAGRATRLVGTNRDVTVEREAATERERLLAAAEAANRAKSEFLAIMSHELRTPLNAIGGYAELIELGIHGPVTEAQRNALERIQRSQRHLLGLIAGVLDYSRVEAGAVSYHLTAVPVVEAVNEAEVLVAPQLRGRGLGYAWSGAAPDLAVRADREKLQQILLNLLGNAVKFTHARDGVPGRVEVSCTVDEAGGRVALHVRDTGAGIAPDQIDRVFEPFVQVDQRLTRSSEGVGLGLAISRDLARGMGGDLTAESTPGVGSTFTLTLPRA